MKPVKSTINKLLRVFGYQVTRIGKQLEQGPKIPKPDRSLNSGQESQDHENQLLERQQKVFREKFDRYAKTRRIVKLHIGSGPRVLKGWANIDLVFEPFEPYMKYYTNKHYQKRLRGTIDDFYKLDVTQCPLPIPDNSVDVIFHEDFIEHIRQRDQVAFLSETLRVLKKGAIHRVNTPDLSRSMKDKSDFSKGYRGVYFEEWDKHKHLSVLTKSSLNELALMVGYSKVVFNEKNKSTSPLVPLEYRPDPNDRPKGGNLHADLIK